MFSNLVAIVSFGRLYYLSDYYNDSSSTLANFLLQVVTITMSKVVIGMHGLPLPS